MKKVLFATTALVASAGIASAQSSLDISGYAEMGIVGGDGQANGETQFHSDFQIDFAGAGTMDNGLTFGFTAQLDDGGGTNVNGTPAWDSESVFISGDWGTLTLGEVDGAYDWGLAEIGDAAYDINDDSTTHAGFNFNSGLDFLGGGDGQMLRYTNSFGDFGVAVSFEQLSEGAKTIGPFEQDGFNYGIGVTYDLALSGADLGFGLAYSWTDGNAHDLWNQVIGNGAGADDIVGVSIDAQFANGFRAIFNYSDGIQSQYFGADTEYMGLGLSYTTGPLTVAANYGEYDDVALLTANGADHDGFGAAVNYDLGGGAMLLFGYTDARVNFEIPAPIGVGFGSLNGEEAWSFGLSMSF